MNTSPQFFKILVAALALALAGGVASAGDETSLPPAPPPSAATPPAVATPAPAKTESAAAEAPSPAPAVSTEANEEVAPPVPPRRPRHSRRLSPDRQLVVFNHDAVLAKGEHADQVVVVMGSADVRGDVSDQVVTVLGSSLITGTVGGQVVTVGGNVYINGPVGDQVVAVLGNVKLGPRAVVGGQVVSVGGTVSRDPDAQVGGRITQEGFAPLPGLRAWGSHALFKGRILAWGEHLRWLWVFSAVMLGFYVVLALIFRRAVEKCAETLEQHPGFSVLAAVLAMLLTPLLVFLLLVTIIGIPLVPVLLAALLAGQVFGMVGMRAWVGRRFTKLFGAGPSLHVAVPVLLGGVILALLYLVPVLGLVVWILVAVLGLGTVIYAVISSLRREPTAPAAPAAPAVPPLAAPSVPIPPLAPPLVSPLPAAVGAPPPVVTAEPGAIPPLLPPVPAAPVRPPLAALPRVGFWLRIAATVIDTILIGICCGVLHLDIFLLAAAAYYFGLWWWRGTTIGGIVLGLKVVRLDDRKVDAGVAAVRVLGAMLSLVCLGLGFIWVAFDDERQSWHDKIAGTAIVRLPKGISLI